MNDKIIDPLAPASARRKLIRGAFATPVVFTICSGSALAASSAAVRAIANQVNNAATYPTGGAALAYLTVPRYKDSAGGKWVVGSDLPQLIATKGRTVYLSSTQYQDVKNSPYSTTFTMPPNLQLDGTNRCAVRVDASGNVVGVVIGTGPAGTSAVTNSVWTSFAASL